MTSATSRTAANAVLVAAGIAAAYVIITTPPLRRLGARMAYMWFGASVPAYLLNEVRRAWLESGQAA